MAKIYRTSFGNTVPYGRLAEVKAAMKPEDRQRASTRQQRSSDPFGGDCVIELWPSRSALKLAIGMQAKRASTPYDYRLMEAD